MAEIWGAAIVAGGTLINGVMQSNAAGDAANASQNAENQAIQQQNLNYQRAANNLSPYTTAGTNAINQMTALNNGDYSSFKQSPDYQFTLNQGLQGVDRSAAARGSLYSGGQSADLLNYAEGLANQQYNSYYNKIAGLAGMGLQGASTLANVGTNTANQLTNSAFGNAANQTNAIYNGQNATSNMIGQISQGLGQWSQMPTTPTTTTQPISALAGGWNPSYSSMMYNGSSLAPNYSLATAGTGYNGY
jgi:hypothetical protein